MTLLYDTVKKIVAVDRTAMQQTQALLDNKTKPRRSLGRLEDLACQLGGIRPDWSSSPEKAIVVMAADHGVAEEGVSAFPQEVTVQMLLNFASGGAAINVLARHAKVRVLVVDMGTKTQVTSSGSIRSCRIGPGTKNFTHEPAMTRDEAIAALEDGIAIGKELAREGRCVIGLGDMGIGNTTSASALVSVFCLTAPEDVTGRGTGVDDDGLVRKVNAIRKGIERNKPNPDDALDTLAKLGGFEIAGLAGVALGAASDKCVVVMDGFISSAAVLTAVRLCPPLAGYVVASHRSVEKGHRIVLEGLGMQPLLDLDLRLGEGTGAALAMNLIDASLKILHEMATFSSAGVSDAVTALPRAGVSRPVGA